MTWLTLRQHRAQIVGLLAVAIMLTVGIWLVADYAQRSRAELGVDTCVPQSRTVVTPAGPRQTLDGNNCFELLAEWQRRVGPLSSLVLALYVVPALVASFIGGPLFAVEFERATHRLAWTQSISRLRWAGLKLGIVVAVALIAAVILGAAVGPSRVLMGIGRWAAVVRPFETVDIGGAGLVSNMVFGRVIRPFEGFDIEGSALVSYMVFGVAVAAFVGAWSRRILVGMFVGLLVFGLVRVGVYNLRPWYETPVIVAYESQSQGVHVGEPLMGQIPNDAWIIDLPAVDPEGRPVSRERVSDLLNEYYRIPQFGPPSATNNDSTYLAEHGVFRRVGYQPADRYWSFQAIEAAIFTGLAALFALLTLWRVRTHDA